MTATATSAGGVRSADGTTIAFERTGTGPVLILVDAAGHYRDFSSFGTLTGLLAPDFSVFTYDRRGRSRSTDTLPYAIEREVDDLAALIAEAGGSAFVYGVSSGALLALQAAASGLAIPKLALFEPPSDPMRTRRPMLTSRAGSRIWWLPATAAMPSSASISASACLVRSVTAPTLVIDSEGSTGDLTGWAAAIIEALPNGTHRSLTGEWHGVPDEDLAPVLTEFFRS
jgi:pimeloyl-ACP methyl ester carboxylesterase